MSTTRYVLKLGIRSFYNVNTSTYYLINIWVV